MSKNINKVRAAIRYWSQIFILPIYVLSYLVPRNDRIWLFGSTFGKRFADNPKYFYLYMQQNHKDIRAIWITKDRDIAKNLNNKGYEAYYAKSLKGFFYCLRGKIYFFDNYSKDISFYLSGGAIKYNFWHGIPLKKIQMDNKFDEVRHPKNSFQWIKWVLRRLSDEKPSHYIVTTSEFLHPIFQSAFQTKKVEIFSYPRNEFLRTSIISNVYLLEEEEVLNQIKRVKENKKFAIYMPTFRESENKFFEKVSIQELNTFLNNNNIYLAIKLHPKSKLIKLFQSMKSENILVIPADYDPYPYLKESDFLITDYSSIYFDYLLLNKPIIFFAYDKEEYLSQSREMYFDYEEFTPGIKAKNMKELSNAIISIYDQDNQWAVRRKYICEKVFKTFKSNELNNLYERIRDLLNIK